MIGQEVACSGVMVRLGTEEKGSPALPSADAKCMLFPLLATRRLEEAILSLDKDGPAHSSMGQAEAPPTVSQALGDVGVARREDVGRGMLQLMELLRDSGQGAGLAA